MSVTYMCLAYAKNVLGRIGPMGIDAATRIVGFFVSAMGVGLIFHEVITAHWRHIDGGQSQAQLMRSDALPRGKKLRRRLTNWRNRSHQRAPQQRDRL
jgi:hypothetical protein